MSKCGLALLFCAASLPALGQELAASYLCVADSAAGFSFDKANKTWRHANFRTDKKYILSRSKQPGVAWDVKDFGVPVATCKSNFNDRGFLFCQGFGYEFRFNKNNSRFMIAYLIGYWSDSPVQKGSLSSDEGANTPSIEIGKCSPL